jgi:hypothetical protein
MAKRKVQWPKLTKRTDPTGVFRLLQQVAKDRFADPAGIIQFRGKWPHKRKAGPGRRAADHSHPTGTKLLRRIIRHTKTEGTAERNQYARLTGHHYAKHGAAS